MSERLQGRTLYLVHSGGSKSNERSWIEADAENDKPIFAKGFFMTTSEGEEETPVLVEVGMKECGEVFAENLVAYMNDMGVEIVEVVEQLCPFPFPVDQVLQLLDQFFGIDANQIQKPID